MGLSPRQMEVLRWIAEGSPERDWPDWSHRVSARSLASRGLVTVRGRGATWTAEVTDHGRRVLNGEDKPSGPANSRRDRAAGRPNKPVPTQPAVDHEALAAELVAAPNFTIRIVEPSGGTRAAHRRAIAAVCSDLLPPGMRIAYSGRDQGDLVIRLVDQPTPVPEHLAVPIPEALDSCDPLVAWLRAHPEHLDVSAESRERALLIIQGLSAALSSQGHSVTHPDESHDTGVTPATLEVTIAGERLSVSLHEHRTKVQTVSSEDAARLKYDWQRATPVPSWEFDGRLALTIIGHRSSRRLADGRRWTLESRLPHFVSALEELAQGRRETRARANEARQQRRRLWEEAVHAARKAYANEVNRQRLSAQLQDHEHASNMRDYADAIEYRAEALDTAARGAALRWARWVRGEADRCDPLTLIEALMLHEPAEIRPWDLDKFMPSGFTASRPPD